MEKGWTSSVEAAGFSGGLRWFLAGAFTWAIAPAAQESWKAVIVRVAAVRLQMVRQHWARLRRVVMNAINLSRFIETQNSLTVEAYQRLTDPPVGAPRVPRLRRYWPLKFPK